MLLEGLYATEPYWLYMAALSARSLPARTAWFSGRSQRVVTSILPAHLMSVTTHTERNARPPSYIPFNIGFQGLLLARFWKEHQ
jgi:hypothetical protein